MIPTNLYFIKRLTLNQTYEKICMDDVIMYRPPDGSVTVGRPHTYT